MRHAVVLAESFDNPYTWQWTKRTPQQYVATFNADANEVIVEITDDEQTRRLRDGDPDDANVPGDGKWDVLFSVRKTNGHQTLGIMHWGDQTKAQRILATVVQILSTFTKTTREPIRVMTFTSMDLSRSKLYARMVQRYLRQDLPHFSFVTQTAESGATEFVLTNTRLS